ncbi:MAG: aminotransferase class V-fold PLP-dependent enzyme [Beijerinckiaceae bacterium]|nr:aminotransferase class V-fold PLP-dependent enzyme [Beijerinckiaceae bacterium]
MSGIKAAVAALGPGDLQEAGLRRHIDPLFSRVLRETSGRIYLANHSLGRPLDRTAADVEKGLALWYRSLDEAWVNWLEEMVQFRSLVASLIHAPGAQCIVPKTSAGQGLRAVLNRHDSPLRVIATRSEFNSIDVILKAYAARGRNKVNWISPSADRRYMIGDFTEALRGGADLCVLSLVFFDTGQLLAEIGAIIGAAKVNGVPVLLDVYHAAGALPVDIEALDVDFAIGGSYKYLRGGPGAAWLYVHPRHLDGPLRTLDTGWFATAEPFAFERPELPSFAREAEGWLESTPAVLPFYQARAGLEFTLAIGVERLRAYSLKQQAYLAELLAEYGIAIFDPGMPRGAFIAIPAPGAETAAAKLSEAGVTTDAREGFLRLCPDILNSSRELQEAARRTANVLKSV